MKTPAAVRALLPVLVLFIVSLVPGALSAQESTRPTNVISANPFGLLLEFFNAEYERAVSPSSTMGLGGSFLDIENDTYVNFDGFWRYYPQGTAFDGWAFGAKLGVTRVNEGTYAGFGFDANRSWLMGADENFYVGIGFGLKRLIGTGDASFDTFFIPTIRIVNIGIAF